MNSWPKAAALRNSRAPSSWCRNKREDRRAPAWQSRKAIKPLSRRRISPRFGPLASELIAQSTVLFRLSGIGLRRSAKRGGAPDSLKPERQKDLLVFKAGSQRTGTHTVRLLRSLFFRSPIIFAAALAVVVPNVAHSEARPVIGADTGKVLEAENANVPWYPASVTKLMTAYVTLQAVKDGKLTLDTLLTVSPTAASQSPSKMGFRPGTQVTVDNALKMMLVKSANDMAVVLAEGVGGSIDGFSVMMNDTAKRLGMVQTSYVNPNGLPADGQITSARDLAILARSFIKNLPEYEYFVHIPAIRYGKRITQNFNKLIGRYPGADGFKTGFICASGYNLVASATRDGRRLIAVVLGTSSGTMRAVRAAQLLDRGFTDNALSWLRPSLGTVDQLQPVDASPPNLHDEVCGGKHHHVPTDEDDALTASTAAPGSSSALGDASNGMFLSSSLQAPLPKPSDWLSLP